VVSGTDVPHETRRSALSRTGPRAQRALRYRPH